MKKRKFAALGLCTALILSMMTGCANKKTEGSKPDVDTTTKQEESQENKGEKVKLRLMSISTDGNQTTILEDYIKKNIAEALPNVEVEFEPGGGGDDMCNKLKTYNASGDLPDVWYSTTDSAVAILNAGNMQNLTDYVTNDKFIENYNVPDALKFSDGNIYCITSGADTYFTPRIFYNTEIFAKYNLSIPKTYDELLEVCKTLKENGEIPMAIPGQGGWAPQLYLIQTMIQAEDPQVAIDILNNKTDFSNPVAINAANRIQQMVQAGAFPQGVTNLSYTNARDMFTSGRCAMFGGFTWEVPNFAALTDVKVDMFMWPSAKEGVKVEETTQYWGSPLNGYAVNPNSKNVEMAVKLAEFCVQQEALFYANGGSMLNYKTEVNSDSTSELMNKNIDIYNATKVKIPSMTLNCMDSKVNAEFATLGANLLTGDYSGEDFSRDFNKVWKENTWFK